MEFALDRYEVQPGDTVQRISMQSGIPVDKLRRWNKLFGNEVYASQVRIACPTAAICRIPHEH